MEKRASPTEAAAPGVAPPNYSCLRCGERVHLRSRDAVKCEACEYRIMMKMPSAQVLHRVKAR